MSILNRAVFLDRDGVINKASVRDGLPYPPKDLSELEIIAGVREALSELHSSNYLLIVITNQPDVARGTAKKEDIENINNYLFSQLPLDGFQTCYHDDLDNCVCRKPKPGALLEASTFYNIDLKKSFMVGDRWRDIAAGASAGCTTIFIDYCYNERKPNSPGYTVKSLSEATHIILESI
tara:strand:+ start:2437 stop:2973 length:537 start_codon:yes stop_codon:yes gene_type:complete